MGTAAEGAHEPVRYITEEEGPGISSIHGFHGLKYSSAKQSSATLLHVKTQKNHKTFSQLSATLIVQLKIC